MLRTPRPKYEEESGTKKERHETLLLGTNQAGVVAKIFTDRIEINGYYDSEIDEGKKYANLRKPVIATWEEIEKAKRRVTLPPGVAEAMEPDYEDEPSEEYLESLPVVNLNGNPFYIDGRRKERRPVSNPKQVFVYFKKKENK